VTAQTLRPERDRAVGRRVGLLVTWVLAMLGGLLVASTTKIGPVVLSITENHGVHTGDLVGFALFHGAALLTTVALRPRRARPAADAPVRPASAPPPSWTPPPTVQWPPPTPRARTGGPWPGRVTGHFRGDESATRRLQTAPRRAPWADDAPTRPIPLGDADDTYRRRAG